MTIVAPAAPGGLYSLFARLIGSKLEQRLGKPFIVENRPGASSIVGAMSVIRAPHDGYTLMVANTSGLAANVSLHKSLPYDPVKDFAPIALLATCPRCWWSTPRCRCIRWRTSPSSPRRRRAA